MNRFYALCRAVYNNIETFIDSVLDVLFSPLNEQLADVNLDSELLQKVYDVMTGWIPDITLFDLLLGGGLITFIVWVIVKWLLPT